MQTFVKDWKIGIVIPWFGKELKGGAEQYAWQIATRLKNIGCKVTALSTCSQSFLHKWHVNYYKPGLHKDDGIDVIRFPVIKRNTHQFNHVVGKLLSIQKNKLKPGLIPISKQEEKIYWQENINSPELISFLKKEYESFDFFIFLPYLFPSIMDGINAVSEKALLQPCLHDECYAYLAKTMEGIYRCKALLFNSKGEFQLAKNIYGNWIEDKSFVVGGGIEHYTMSKDYSPSKQLPENYILYVGRKCKEKNTPLLIECFDRYCRENPSSKLYLILAGPASVPIPEQNPRIIDLGLVDKDLKSFLMSHSKALINPSINESLSRVMFESWYEGRPVIVHKQCLATYEALKDSGFSGWFVDSNEDFQSIFGLVDKIDHQEVIDLGQKGQIYTKKISDWNEVMNRYITCFSSLSPQTVGSHTAFNPRLLLIVPQAKLNCQEQFDLDQFLLSICNKGHWQVELLANNHKIEDTYRYLPNLIPASATSNNPDLAIWYGESIWEKGINFLGKLNTKIVRKSVLRQNFEEVKIDAKQLVPIIEKESVTWPCPSLFPIRLLQKEKCDKKKFEYYNKECVNILLLANIQNQNFLSIVNILETFARKNNVKVSILLPEPKTEANSAQLEVTDKITWSLFPCKEPFVIPSHIYQVSDCMLIIDPIDLPPWFSIGACSHNLPTLKLSDAKKVSNDFYQLNPEIDFFDEILAFIKLACGNNSVRDSLQNINYQILKSYIPGNSHTKIQGFLQDIATKESAPQ